MKDLFLLDYSITNLNHGSFGACPKPIFEDYQKWQFELERSPVQFMVKTGLEQLNLSKSELAEFVGCDPMDVVFTTNPSYAFNIVAKSFPLNAGDEILTTDLEYGAMDRTWNYYTRKAGAKYVRQHVNLPIQSKEAFLDDFWKGYTKNTKAVFISHITSST